VLQDSGLIPVVDEVVARNGDVRPSRKPPKPSAIVTQAEAVPDFLRAVSDVEPSDLSGRMYASEELSRHAADERRRREQREAQIAAGKAGTDPEDPGWVDMVVAEVDGTADLRELAGIAARTLRWGAPLAVRVPTALLADAIHTLDGPLHFTYTFVDVASEATPVALPIPLERRASLTLLFRQRCPKGREAHKQALIGDVVIHDRAVDPLVLLGRLVGAYTHPGDLVLVPSGDGAVVELCHDLDRRTTADPDAGPDGTPDPDPTDDAPSDRPAGSPVARRSARRPAPRGELAPQLEAEWESPDVVSVRSGDRRIALLPVERVARHRIVRRSGDGA